MVKVTKSISYLQVSRANNYFDLENPESVERFALLHGFYRKEANKVVPLFGGGGEVFREEGCGGGGGGSGRWACRWSISWPSSV